MGPLAEAMRNKLMLGLFLPIQSGGWSPSLQPRGTDWSFDYNAALTRRCEELGFEYFGIGRGRQADAKQGR